MPQLMALLLVGATAYVGYRTVKERIARSRQRRDESGPNSASARQNAGEAGTSGREPKNLGSLELDPATGLYRPRGD